MCEVRRDFAPRYLCFPTVLIRLAPPRIGCLLVACMPNLTGDLLLFLSMCMVLKHLND